MLTLEQFCNLPMHEQLNYFWENCLLLSSRTEEGAHIIKLYYVGRFFAEIRFESPDSFQIVQFFSSWELLFPYVEKLDISELLK